MEQPAVQTDRKPSRRFWLWLLAIHLIPTLLVAGFLYRIAYAKPTIAVDYSAKLTELQRTLQGMPADAFNAWDLISRRSAAVEQHQHTLLTTRFSGEYQYNDFLLLVDPTARLSPAESRESVTAATRKTFATYEAAGLFEGLEPLVDAKYAVATLAPGPQFERVLPEVGQIRLVVRGNLVRMKAASDEQRFGDRAAILSQNLAIARHFTAQPSWVERRAAAGWTMETLEELRRQIIESPPPADRCRALIAIIDAQTRSWPATIQIEASRASVLDIIQRSFTDNGRGGGRYLPYEYDFTSSNLGGFSAVSDNRHEGWRLKNLRGLLTPGRRETVDLADQHFAHLYYLFGLQPPSSASPPSLTPPDPARVDANPILSRGFLPRLDRLIAEEAGVRSEIAGTRLMLLLEIQRASAGSYSAALSAVEVDHPGSTTDPANGKPFAYSLLENDPGGRGYLIYSLGADGADDGGREDQKDRRACYLPKQRTASDFILNHPRPPTPTADAGESPESPQ
ncbi:MAG: hypothetical protein KF869_03575 [Phycisphaeraceae bacterium]|nr:hypothetical protein [Phycisphaeraceae bacterium]